MIKSAIAFTSALFFSASAFAAVTTIEFTPAEGEAVTIAFDDATGKSTNVATGEVSDYTFNQDSGELCGTDAEGQPLCVTFENSTAETKVGDEGAYTASNGASGTAKVIDIQE